MLRNTPWTAILEVVALLLSTRAAVEDGFILATMNQRAFIINLQSAVDRPACHYPVKISPVDKSKNS